MAETLEMESNPINEGMETLEPTDNYTVEGNQYDETGALEMQPDPPFTFTQEAINKAFRGKKKLPWLERALDPTTPALENAGVAHTSSVNTRPDGMGAEMLFPTVRQNTEGNLVQLSDEEAYNKAVMEDDWLSFDSPQAATAYSKMLSEQIGDRRAAHQQKLKEQEEQLKAEEDSASPTPALLPEEVIARYHGVMDLLREVGDSENSADNIHQVISWIENEENLFNRERGIYGGLDLGRPFPSKTEKDKEGKPIDLTLLQQLEILHPRGSASPGFEIVKEYLKDKWLEENRSIFEPKGNYLEATWNIAGKLRTFTEESGKAIGDFVLDMPNMAGNAGYSTAELIGNITELVLNPPGLRPLDTYLTLYYEQAEGLSSEEAKLKARSEADEMFRWSTYAGEKLIPKTASGQAVATIGEYGIGVVGGKNAWKFATDKLLKWGKGLDKAQVVTSGANAGTIAVTKKVKEWGREIEKINPTDFKTLEKVAKSTPVATGIGGTVGVAATMSPENRLLPYLEELGMPPEYARMTAEAPDDTTFMKYLKNFYNASVDVAGFENVLPAILAGSRAMYYWSKPYSEEAIKKAQEGMSVATKWLDKLRFLYPKKAGDRKPRYGNKEGIEALRRDSQTELQELIKADKEGTLLKALDKRGYTVNEKGVIVQKGLVPKEPKVKTQTLDIPDVADEQALIFQSLSEEDKAKLANDLLRNPEEFSEYNSKILNVDRVTTDEDALNYVKRLTSVFDTVFKKGKKTTAQTLEEGKRIQREVELWVGPDEYGSYLEKFAGMTKNFPALQAAIRTYLWEESKAYIKSSRKIAGLGENATPEDLVNHYLDTFKYFRAIETDTVVGSNIGRTLQVRNQLLNGSNALKENVIKAGAYFGDSGKKTMLEVSNLVSQIDDPAALREFMKRKGPLYHSFEILKGTMIGGYISGPVTQLAAHLGALNYLTTRKVEQIGEITLNTIAREWSDRTGRSFLGFKGEGMSLSALNAEAFALNQVLFEMGAGGFFTRSPLASMGRGIRDLKSESLGSKVNLGHELTKTQVGGSGKTIRIFGDIDIAVPRGVNEEVFGDYLETAFMKGDYGTVLKYMMNSVGVAGGIAGRGIIGGDAFWRNIIERMELHKRAMIEAFNRVRQTHTSEGTLKAQKKIVGYKQDFMDEVYNEYMYTILNPSDKLLERVKKEASIALMQKPGEKYIFGKNPLKGIEDYKNPTSNIRGGKPWIGKDKGETIKNIATNVGKAGENIVDNTPRAFVAGMLPFLRTMTGITQQYTIDRSPLKFLDMLRKAERDKILAGDEAAKQEVLAKIGFGSLLIWGGYGLAKKKIFNGDNFFSEFFLDDDEDISMEGLDSSDPAHRSIKYAEGGRPLEIKYHTNGKVYSIPLDRLDSGRAALALGAIIGSAHQEYNQSIQMMDINLQDGANLKQTETFHRVLYALQDWLLAMPAVEGVEKIATTIFPGIDPYGKHGLQAMMKEPLKFGMEFLSPWLTYQSSLRKGAARSFDPFAVMGPSAETFEKVDRPPLSDNLTRTNPVTGEPETILSGRKKDGTLIPVFKDEKGKFREDKREHLTEKAGILYDAIHRYREDMHKISIMDRTNIRYPKAGQNLYGVVGPEGDLVKFMPHLKLRSLERSLATMALPIVTRLKVKTTTGDLSLGLNVPLKDARQWQTPVAGISLTPAQRYAWAVYVGRLNKKSFTENTISQGRDPFTKERMSWALFSERLNNGKFDDITHEKSRLLVARLKRKFTADMSKNREKGWKAVLAKFPKLRATVRTQDRINNLKGK